MKLQFAGFPCIIYSALLGLAPLSLGRAQIAIEVAPPNVVEYDPFDGFDAVGKLMITLQNDEDAARAANLLLAPSDGSQWAFAGAGGEIPFVLTSPDAPDDVILGPLTIPVNLPAEGAREITVQYEIKDGLFALPGEYFQTLDISVADDVSGDALSEAPALVLSASVPSRAQANIAGAAGNFDASRNFPFVDFGTLETGESRQIFVQVRANAESLITVTSDNGGRLMHDENASYPNANYWVGYAIVLDGEASTLESPLQLVRTPVQSLDGNSYPMIITIGDVAGKPAGTYRDYINVDILPQ